MKRIVDKPEFTATIIKGSDGRIYLDALGLKTTDEVDLNKYDEMLDIDNIIGHMGISYPSDICHVEKLILPRNVQEVGIGAFQSSRIRSIVWPTACEKIPERAFMSSSLKEISNIGHVKSIGSEAFRSCHIRSFEIPDGVTDIPQDCFLSSFLTTISGGRNVEIFQPLAFYHCNHMETFNIPPKVTKIPQKCFFACRSLINISGMEHIRSFGEESFAECESLGYLFGLDNTFEIKKKAFYHSGSSAVADNIE